MKLYEVPRNSWVIPIGEVTVPPGAIPVGAEPVLFHHCDGMYSYCHNIHGELVHVPAYQEVQVTEPPINLP